MLGTTDSHIGGLEMDETKYNGWKNKATWIIALYLSDYIEELLKEAVDNGYKNAYELTGTVESEVTQFVEEDLKGQNAISYELLHYALNQVDWDYLTSSALEEVIRDYKDELKTLEESN